MTNTKILHDNDIGHELMQEDEVPPDTARAALVRDPVDRYWSATRTMFKHEKKKTAPVFIGELIDFLRDEGRPWTFGDNPHCWPQVDFHNGPVSRFPLEEMARMWSFFTMYGVPQLTVPINPQNQTDHGYKATVQMQSTAMDNQLLRDYYAEDVRMWHEVLWYG
jgi:hypothetical protein